MTLRQSSADSDKDRHVRRHHDSLGYHGLRGERIDCDDRVRVSVSDDVASVEKSTDLIRLPSILIPLQR